MRDADSYEDIGRNCFDAVMEDNPNELSAQLDAMTVDDLHALSVHADELAKIARLEWLNRTTRPADG